MPPPIRSGPSIRSQLVVLAAAVAVPLTVLAGYNVYTDFHAVAAAARNEAAALAGATGSSVSQFLANAEQILTTLTGDPRVTSPDHAVCQAAIEPATTSLPQFQPILVADTSGTLVCAGLEMTPQSRTVTDRRWFVEALRSDRFTLGDPVIGRITGRPVVILSMAARDSLGAPLGVVGVAVGRESLQRLVTSVPVPAGTIITLADLDGVVVARSKDADTWIGRRLPREPGVDLQVEGDLTGFSRARDGEGVDRVFAWRRVPGTRWVVFAGIPASQAFRDARSTLLTKSLLTLLAGLLAFLLAGRIHRRITSALGDLMERMSRAGGAGPQAIPETGPQAIPETGPQEIAAVARQFNQTLAARAQAEDAMAQANERYRSIVRNAVFGIYVTTPDGVILDANPAFAAMVGAASPDALVGTDESAFFTDPAEWERCVAAALAAGVAPATEVEWVGLAGKHLKVRLYRSSFHDARGETALEVVADDQTERRALEDQFRQSQKMEAVGRLAGGVAHDFNNRLMVIQGHLEMLAESLAEDPELTRHMDAIRHAADGATSLTAQLLAFSRKDVIRARGVDLNDVIGRFAALLPGVLGEDLAIVTDFAHPLPTVVADPGQIEQILLNLAVNARDAMPDGGTLTIRTTRRRVSVEEARAHADVAPGDYVAVRVEDTGTGMAEEVLARIFEPFFTTKPVGKGSGLGMAMVFGLVQQHQGLVTVTSEPGRGTTVEVLLPVSPVGSVAEDAEPVTVPASGGSALVLVAEDEDEVRAVVAWMLARGGHRVLAASDGSEALDIADLHGKEIDLLVTDIVMPGLRGTVVADRFQASHPGRPVLFMSGYSDAPPPLEGEGGPRDFVRKPVKAEELLRAVAGLLARSQGPRSGG